MRLLFYHFDDRRGLECRRHNQHQFGHTGCGSLETAGWQSHVFSIRPGNHLVPACWRFRCWLGSAAYGVAEAFGWHATLEAKAPDAVGFYAIIAAATVIGFRLGFTNIDAIHMLVWSAVLNGIVAVPIMAMMMVLPAV